jgi:hypothetical protein
MQYIIKDIKGEEHGPIDSETLAKWVDEDRITGETSVRSTLMPNWKTADQIDFLKERLSEQELRKQKAATMVEKSGSIFKKAKSRLGDKILPKVQSKFEQKRPPQYVQMAPRALAALYDFSLILFIGAIILLFVICGFISEFLILKIKKIEIPMINKMPVIISVLFFLG